MTELSIKQVWFTRYLSELLKEFDAMNITMGEAWRSDETCRLYAKEGKGVPFSCHEMRLAIDLNLIVNGNLSTLKSDYQPLGDFWKELPHTYPADIPVITCWGGDFASLYDPFHFSITHNGIK